jgi:hypothetical protein
MVSRLTWNRQIPEQPFYSRQILNASHKRAAGKELISFVTIAVMIVILSSAPSSFATTKGLSQIVTPDLQAEGDLLSL